MSFALIMVLAAGPLKIASPPWNVVDIKPELASFYAEQMAQALRAEGFKVTTSDDISTLLGAERQRELLGCSTTTTSCMAELANALGCDATLTVNLARLGGGFRGLAKLMSSNDGSILSSVKIDATTEAQLADRVEAAAKELAKPFRTQGAVVAKIEKVEKPPAEPVKVELPPEEPVKIEKSASMGVAPKLWWLPGAIGLVPVVVGGVMIGLAADRYAALLSPGATSQQGSAWAAAGAGWQGLGWIIAGVGGAAIAGSVLWLLLGSTDVQPQVSITPSGASLGVGGRF